ncbi:hypothetical protein ACFLZK_01490 [Patescibacteria group bacterium]
MLKEIVVLVLIFVISCPLSVIGGSLVVFIGDHPNIVYKILRMIAQLTIFGLAYLSAETASNVFFNIFGLSHFLSLLLSFIPGSIVFAFGILPHFPKIMEAFVGTETRLKHNE